MIRLARPSIDEMDIMAVAEVLRTGYLVQGPRVREFEEKVAAAVGARHAVAVSNCTAALHLALLALDIGSGDRVAVTAYSWPATANVIVLCGAEPVFVDIDPLTFNMDPAALAKTLARERGIKAILPIHAFGGMADLPRLLEAAAEIPLLEDAACALGSALNGKPAGAWGVAGCFSFHPRKAITTGEGGMVVTDDDALARRVRMLRNHGLDPDAATPDFVAAGFNMRMTDFQAALGLAQLRKMERIIAARQARAARYDELLAATGLRAPIALPGSRHIYQSYVALLPAELASARDEIIAALRAREIETTIGTYHLPLTTFFRRRGGYQPGDFPVADDVFARALTLPLHEFLTDDEQQRVAEALDSVLSERRSG